jgi:MFS family permease
MSAVFVQVSVSTIAARDFASGSVATVPIGLVFAATAASSTAVPRLAHRIGARPALLLCSLMGIAGALLNFGASYRKSFPMLAVGSLLQGPNFAATLYLRFAVLQFVSREAAAKAIALVVAGGVLSAAGPELARGTRTALAQDFAGSYVANTAIFVVFGLLLFAVDFDAAQRVASARHEAEVMTAIIRQRDGNHLDGHGLGAGGDIENLEKRLRPRSLRELARQPAFVVAIISTIVAYSAMTSLMGATPVAMSDAGLGFQATSLAITVHSLGRYMPSFVSGRAVAQVGSVPIMVLGYVVQMAATLAFLAGRSEAVFVTAIFFVGAGWSLSFVASTRLLTKTYHAYERARVQGFTDTVTLVAMTATTVSASSSLQFFGLDTFAGLHFMYESLGLLTILTLVVWRWWQKRRGLGDAAADDNAGAGRENEEEAQACLAVELGLGLHLDGPVHRLQCSQV